MIHCVKVIIARRAAAEENMICMEDRRSDALGFSAGKGRITGGV